MREFIKRWRVIWFWYAVTGACFGSFVGYLIAGPLHLAVWSFIGFVFSANALNSELEWRKEQRRLESIARERGLANFMDAHRTSA